MKRIFSSWAKSSPLPMIILNLTPDSFSDGGILLHQGALSERLKSLEKEDFLLVDLGAQSTAPSAVSISGEEEIKRLEEYFFDQLPKDFFSRTRLIFSLDTFRAETLFWFEEKIRKRGYQHQLLWNDVSGIVDENVTSFLRNPFNTYVFCHNRVKSREESPKHMDFAPKEFIFEEMLDFFKKYEGRERFIFDPCFGFAKSYEENLFWLKELPKLMENLKGENPFLIGLSRKSLLRRLVIEKLGDQVEAFKESEVLHLEYLKKFTAEAKGKDLIFRLHDPQIYKCL
jgi:dihydropteroate synthase